MSLSLRSIGGISSGFHGLAMKFFKIGQVGQFISDYHTLWCPKDVATRGGGKLKTAWLARYVKVTSYTWNGTIGGYVPTDKGMNGKTYKYSDFLGNDWQMWEQNETDGFYFNDAGTASNSTVSNDASAPPK
jgi:hypothetical protein